MVVTCVFNIAIPEGKNGQQIVDGLQTKLEQMGATKIGTLLVDCELYQSLLGTQKNVYVLHHADRPASSFSFIDTGATPGATGVLGLSASLISDQSFDKILGRLNQFYQKKQTKVEARGPKFSLVGNDLIVKVVSVVSGQMSSFKGILVEIEYGPCCVANDCWPLLREFTSSFLGQSSATIPNQYFRSSMDRPQSGLDTAQQYLWYFLQMQYTTTNISLTSSSNTIQMQQQQGMAAQIVSK